MIETERLLVRPWRDADRAAYHAICRDPEAMRYLGPLQSRAETDAAIDRMIASQAANGFCFWAVERREDGALLGFCGLLPAKPPIVGEIEIGWRLGSDYWGQGFAREAATACLDWAWAHLDVPSVAAITVLANRRSWGLMERLGMTRIEGGDFDHPDAPEDSPLKRPYSTGSRGRAGSQLPGSCFCKSAIVALSAATCASPFSWSDSSAG